MVFDLHDILVGRGWASCVSALDIPYNDRLCDAYDLVDGETIYVTTWQGERVVWSGSSFDDDYVRSSIDCLYSWAPPEGKTAVFSAVFPHLQRTVDYGAWSGLLLLGEVDHVTGYDGDPPEQVAERSGWWGETPAPRNVGLSYLLELVLDPENGENREGFALIYPQEGRPSERYCLRFSWFTDRHVQG